MSTDDPILDDLFHGCAFAAYVEVATANKDWPDAEQARRLAYTFFEEELASKNHRSR